MQRKSNIALCLIALLLLGGCNVVKHLNQNQSLYTGAEVKVNAASKADEKLVRRELEKSLTPEPNQTIAGIRFKLGFYL